ncbi:uncharacterized protein [Musca autumnalis]|uniref:uncharacterized protein n=1 Tax=Musca autumnalis TaxID=221902 RepID=UPI003CEA33E9
MSDNNLKFARGGAELTVELLDKLQAATNKENVLISPLSIQTCMALAFTGAKGETANEIAKVMKFVSTSPEEVAETFHNVLTNYEGSKLVKMANKVYVQEGCGIKPEYAAITKEKYYAAAESINFAENVAAATKINNWVEEKTAGKIGDLIPAEALDSDTRLILLNALHFKGEWQEKFDPADTSEEDFWLNETESTKVQLMRKSGEFRFGYIPDYECEALEIPYKDSDLSMFVLLPFKRDGLQAMADKLKGANLLDLDQQLRTVNDMIVKFPKFKIEYSVELSKVMQEMGIKTAFGAADLSNLLESSQGVNVSEIFHKTCIEVNEEGCEAAAATGFVGTFCCLPPQFKADHPFMYFIWNKKNIFFAGAFVEPPNQALNVKKENMGIKTAFVAADLSNLLESSQGVNVSEIFHKTCIEVNEEGCKAAAATGLVATFRCMPPQFEADHPFMYFIWNKKNIFFAGAFVKPPNQMGIKTAFGAADLSNILESSEGVYVSEIFHKTCIEVNEEGCEAAAATALKPTCHRMPPQFVGDRPFIYFIWNKKNMLFAGVFVKPPCQMGIKAAFGVADLSNILELSQGVNVSEIFHKTCIEVNEEGCEAAAATGLKMGIKTAFGAADLSNLLESSQDVYLSNIFHKTSIEVNEEGCEAVAATGLSWTARCAPPQFLAKRPFMYFIWNKKNILFAGAFMGISKAFNDSADLSNILDSTQAVKVSEIFHKTCIEVNEEGTEAAAATAMKIMLCCMPMEFCANRPFFYFIWNKTNILFAGALINPKLPTLEVVMSDNNLKFVRFGAELTIELLDKLQAATNKENVLISPLSIQTCMALAFTGAKGETANEIAKVMKFVSTSPEEVAETFHNVLTNYEGSKLVKMANKVYVQEGCGIKPEYAAITKEKYYAAAESVNFGENAAATKQINKWVEEKTAGKIADLIPDDALDSDTRLILLNALHFKGEWQEKFDPADTPEDDFWLNENESTKVQFMRKQGEFRCGYLSDYNCKALELRYKDSDLSMFVLLPIKRDGLQMLTDKLKGVNLLDLDQQLGTVDNLIVKLPKLTIEYSIELSNTMKELGVEKAFSQSADISNILETSETLQISEIFHKTSIVINEEGSEAAAATAVKALKYSMPPQFIADHSFYYFIWNKKNILFAGTCVNPKSK